MADLNVDSLKRKFQALNSTQDSIQTLSLWIIHHKNHYRQIIELWMEHLKEAKAPMRLTLFYLANDIIQNSKRKGATVFLDSFAEVLEEAATFSREENIREKVLRIFKIWGERAIYSVEFCDKLQKATVSQKPAKAKPRPDTKLLVDFNHEDVPEVIEQLARFEGEVELKYRQLGMLNVDVASTETIMQLKDRAGGKRFSQQFEDSAVKLEDYVTSLTKEVELRRKLFDLLQKSEIFYEAQFGEAKIVANAYKNFGMRVASLKKRLEEHKALLPDSFSPIPSPTMDAPSPGATPPRDPNSDSIEVEDMELSDEEEDRKGGTIIAPSMTTRRTSRIAALRNKIAATTTTSSTSGISHISTITGAGSRSAFNQPLPSYSPFSSESPPADYSPSEEYLPIPTSAAAPGSAHNSTSMKEGGGENYGQIKDRLLQVMQEPPKLPSSVKLFDSPGRTGSKRSSGLPPVTIPSYTPSPKAYDQQVSPIVTVPPAVPAPVPPQGVVDEYDPFKNEYATSAPQFYTPVNNLPAQTRAPSRQPPSPPDDDVYDPEMVDYLLEMPLEKKKKPQSSCIIPLAGGFQSPTTKPEVQKGVDAVVYGSNKPSSVPRSKEKTSLPSVQSKSGLKTANSNKPGGTPLRDECSTPPSQQDSPMLKAATSNPIEFLTKIITSSRQSPGNKAPSSSFLSSLSLLTQTVQSAAQKEKSEQLSGDTQGGESAILESQNPPESQRIDINQQAVKQNNVSPSGQAPVPFSIGALVSSFKEASNSIPDPNFTTAMDAMSGADYRQITQAGLATGISREPHDTTQARSTASNLKQNHANAGSRTPMPFSIGALVSSFHEESKPTPATVVSTPSPVSKSAPFGPAVYQKSNKVPLCQIMNTPAPNTLAVSVATVSSAVTAKPSEMMPAASAGASMLDDETDASQSHSLMARLMQNKTKEQPLLNPVMSNVTPGLQPQPPNFQSLILEPPPPPPLPPEESMDSNTSIPHPPPEDPMQPAGPPTPVGPPPPLGGPPQMPSDPPLPPSGPPPLPPSGPPPPSSPPPPPSGPPPPPICQPPTPSGPPPVSQPPPPVSQPPPPSTPPPPLVAPPLPLSGPPLPPSGPTPHPSGPPSYPSGPPQHLISPPQQPSGTPSHPSGPPSHPSGPPPYPSGLSQQLSGPPPRASQPQQQADQPPPPPAPQRSLIGPPRFSGEVPPTVTGPATPVPVPSPTTRNTIPRMQIRAPPPPPGPPPPNAKRGGSTLIPAGAGPPTPVPHNVQPSDTPPTSPQELASNAHASGVTEHQPSPPASATGPVNPEQNHPADPPQPTSPIPVVGSVPTRSIPVLGQSKSAKDMWEKPPFPSRSPGVSTRYTEFPTQPTEKIDYSHSRPIETLERKRMSYQERFHEDKAQSEVFRRTEQRYDSERDRYPSFPHSNSSRDGGFGIGRGRRYSDTDRLYRHDLDQDRGHGHHYDRSPGMDFRRSHVLDTDLDYEQDHSMGRRQDFDRLGAQEPADTGGSYEQSHFRSTKQLIEKELSALAGDLQPRGAGAAISTLEGRSESGRHTSDYGGHRRDEPQFWRGATKHAGQPTWGRPPPHYRY
ncbi:proline-rich protein 36-like isoform X2 [Patiria miniata]|uniref:Regulation of nuclear pre-mRNA domain-containing protein 2 n=1 Tax=Patiria miniata TaxID=46514 RepID=A0A914BLK3_PATMI|nr:proline-rich protein 36-like isoform X2 [Patiria miniata]